MLTSASSTSDNTVYKTNHKGKTSSTTPLFTQYSNLKSFYSKSSNKISKKKGIRWYNYQNGLESTKVLNPHNIRYPGHSIYTSSNSLQNSSVCWSFSKSGRFTSPKILNHSIYNLPNFKSNRTTTLGFGLRKDLRPKYGVGSPSPDRYNIQTQTDFNISHKKGAKLLHKIKVIDVKKFIPGPGTYTVTRENLMNNMPILLKSRWGFYYDDDLKKKKHCVSPEKYHPNTKWEENWRFRNISVSFGIGKRSPSDLTSVRGNPGPGAYNVPGNFDRGYRGKLALN